MNISDIVQSVIDKKPADFRDSVETKLGTKLLDAIEIKRQELSSGLMKDPETHTNTEE
jgi:hypothetical protein